MKARKHLPLTLCLAAAILCSALLLRKNREVQEMRARASLAEASREAAAEQAAQEAARNNRLRTQLHETRAEAAEKVRAAQKPKRPLASSPPEAKDEPGRRAAIFRDPDMREALAAQAKEGSWKNVKAIFNLGLAEHLHLNEEQASALRQLLLQRTTLLSEQVYLPMMTGELDDAAMAVSGRATRQAYEENSARIRSLLGEEGFRAYEQFEKTQSDRENVRRFAPQFAEAGQTLSAEQQSQLLAAMIEERLGFNFQYDLGNMAQWDFEHWYDNVTDEKLGAYSQDMAQLNDRMLQRAQSVLNPEQAKLFESLLRERALQAKFVVQTTKALTGRGR